MRKSGVLKVMLVCLLTTGIITAFPQDIAASGDEKFNMSYLYFGASGQYTGIVDKTGNSLDAIATSYFDLNGDGSLLLTPALDVDFIKEMHGKGMQVTPFLSNHWDREKGIKALAGREALSTQIAKAVSDYDLDGVDVDIENLTPSEKADYVDFMRLLRQKLPSDKSVSIAVAPNPWNLTTGWNASYDYAGLAQYADYLMIMTYDEHYQGGPEGPVAGADFVENTIKAAVAKVPPEKLVLGIAFYGRYWKQGSSYGGYGVSNSMIDELIRKYNGVVTFDKTAKSPKAVITVKKNDVKPVVLGQKLEAGKYDIWYENEQSIKYKLQLVQKYGLKGTGSWSLGQESQNTWDYYKLWLNGMYFGDVQGYWARDSIIKMVDKGWMVGVSGNEFQPNAPLTRAQAATLLVRALGLVNAPAASADAGFTDTAGHWAQREINIASQYNLVVGTGNGKFSPDLPVTREQMAVMLDRVLGGAGDSVGRGNAFNDVNEGVWSYASIMRIADRGIIAGYQDGNFRPWEKLTRGQMAVLMDRTSPWITNGAVVASLP